MRELIELLRDMHVSSEETRGVGRHSHEHGGWTAYCEYDSQDWPCETVELLNEFAEKLPKHAARPPHPNTMAGR